MKTTKDIKNFCCPSINKIKKTKNTTHNTFAFYKNAIKKQSQQKMNYNLKIHIHFAYICY